jgi:hypothetical protein
MALVAISMVAIIAMAAWSIDLVTLYLARQEAQRAADAGALAATRVISVSGITGTADPDTQPAHWTSICGPNGVATHAAQAAAGQNSVASGIGTVTVNYATFGAGGTSSNNCSTLGTVFAINPLVTVQVRISVPTFFSRAWSYRTESVSATATAEAFNPSHSNSQSNGAPVGAMTPVQPRCVKPWMVPNQDPKHPVGCPGSGPCNKFVSADADGSIVNPGISTGGTGTTGVIGENFTLFADCVGATSPCNGPGAPPAPGTPPSANATGPLISAPTPNLGYWPGETLNSSVAVPSCATAGTGGVTEYEPAVAGCDQSTVYHCGVQSSSLISSASYNQIDLSENPAGATGDTANALACSLTGQSAVPLSGQDGLDTTSYPFKLTAGDNNPLKITSGTEITASNQIVSLPIYDDAQSFAWAANKSPVTIVGFLQVFINQVDPSGNIAVTVLNVAGCGTGTGPTPNPAVTGSSPVPVRLVSGQ